MVTLTRCSRVGFALVTGLVSVLVGCATSSSRSTTDADLQLQRAVVILATKPDADSLAAAGLLSLPVHRDDSLALIARAVTVAPDRPDLVWLQAQVCQGSPPCDPDPMERRLRDLDPTNGAGWINALARASSSKNDEAKEAALMSISHSDRVDIYWTTIIAHLWRAIDAAKVLSPWQAEVTVIGILAAQAIPAYALIGNACKGERLQHSEVIAMCRGVAKACERGDTYITEMIGVAIAKRVWPEDSPEWNVAAEARRLYEYRSKASSQQLEEWDATHAQQTLTMYTKNRREQDVLLARLVAMGKNPSIPLQ
jgi:hypothetical protein